MKELTDSWVTRMAESEDDKGYEGGEGASSARIADMKPDEGAISQNPAVAGTRPGEVFGMLGFGGKARTLEEMELGILTEARHHRR